MMGDSRSFRTWFGGAVIILVILGQPWTVLIGFAGIVIWMLTADRHVLKRVGKPRFWVFTLLITLLAGLLLGRDPVSWYGISVSKEGVLAGLLMNVRAFTLIASIVIVSSGITHERFFSLSTRIGLPHLSPAFNTAIDTVPDVKIAWRSTRMDKRSSLLDSVAHLILILTELSRGIAIKRASIIAVTGKRSSGKTSLLSETARRLEKSGAKVCGFIQQRVLDDSGEISGYRMIRWGKGEDRIVAVKKKGIIGYTFSDEAFALARDWISEDSSARCVFIFDEMGLLESKGRGHARAFDEAMFRYPHSLILVSLRKDKIDALCERFSIQRSRVIDLDDTTCDPALLQETCEREMETGIILESYD